jgi:hypothetical protein
LKYHQYPHSITVTNQPVETELIDTAEGGEPPTAAELKDKYVKYAMKNMVKKRGKSLQHFALSTIGMLTLLIGLAYLTR